MLIIRRKILFVVWIIPLGLIICPRAFNAQSSQMILRFGFYTKDLSKGDVVEMDESLKQWVESIKNNTTINTLASSIIKNTFYDSRKKLAFDISNNNLDFMNISTYDFIDLDLQGMIVPLLVTSKVKENKFERYFLITRKNSPINDISKLSNVQIVIPNSFSSALINIWLQVALKEKLNKKDFAKIVIVESTKKENETLFSIFFNKLDFAVIREDSYLIACEINPQIKNNTKIIATSKQFINNFFARRKDIDPTIYKEIITIGMKLDNTIEGKQILNLMQMTSMHEINLADLMETAQLIKNYKKLFPQNVNKN